MKYITAVAALLFAESNAYKTILTTLNKNKEVISSVEANPGKKAAYTMQIETGKGVSYIQMNTATYDTTCDWYF
jgi:hypothetical protein